MSEQNHQLGRGSFLALCVSLFMTTLACEDSGKKSAEAARANLDYVAQAAVRDVGEVRRGLPVGAKLLTPLFEEASPEQPAAVDAREALLAVRSKNNDLDSAKSTFFLIADADGSILRNNLEEDDMAGKNLFQAYPDSKAALSRPYFELTGSWDVARGVNGRPDAQWVATAQIPTKDNPVAGLLVAGWSWSSYAYRLEMGLRSEVLGETKPGDKVPVLYVYVIVGEQAYGAPVSPEVNGAAIVRLNPLEKAKDGVWVSPLEVTNHTFGLAVQKVPDLGSDVAVAVLRSDN